MTLLDQLATSDAPVVMDLIRPHRAPAVDLVEAWDNRPTWDNWRKKK